MRPRGRSRLTPPAVGCVGMCCKSLWNGICHAPSCQSHALVGASRGANLEKLLRHPQASSMRTRPDATQPAHTNVPNLNRVTGPQTYVMDERLFSAEPFWNMCAADVKRDILCVKDKDEKAEVKVVGGMDG